jgi:hypothetical protein
MASRDLRGVSLGSALAPALALLLVCGCFDQNRIAPLYDWVVPTRLPDPIYEELFPYYVEICAVSQYRPKQGNVGGAPGHAVMYLKGACRDESAAYPRLEPCERVSTSRADPEHGVGISVNRWFKNVNWIATPGKELFYDGDLAPYETLTRAHWEATGQRALALGLYRGVALHDYPAEGERSTEDFVARHSMGTDFALRFGRTVFCTRLPVTEPMLGEVIRYLNDLNEKYATGEADYNWSGYSDNCVHTIHNALAAASVWKPKSINEIKLRQFFHMAIPANTFIDLGDRGLLFPLEDFGRVYDDEVQRQSLERYGWLPTRHGVLMKTLPVHQDNELYDTQVRLMILQAPFRSAASKRANLMLGDARTSELEPNLRLFQARYDAILSEREDDQGFSLHTDRYKELRSRYYAYIETQLAEVNRMLAQLRERARAAATGAAH